MYAHCTLVCCDVANALTRRVAGWGRRPLVISASAGVISAQRQRCYNSLVPDPGRGSALASCHHPNHTRTRPVSVTLRPTLHACGVAMLDRRLLTGHCRLPPGTGELDSSVLAVYASCGVCVCVVCVVCVCVCVYVGSVCGVRLQTPQRRHVARSARDTKSCVMGWRVSGCAVQHDDGGV